MAPSKAGQREHKTKRKHGNGAKMFSADELRRMFDAAGPQFKAMILLDTTHSCRGDADFSGEENPNGGQRELAHSSFGDAVTAVNFAAAAGPIAWSFDTHRQPFLILPDAD